MELTQKADRYKASVITFVFHGLLLLFFILYKIITPLPIDPKPLDGGGGLGMEINFGDSQYGMGNINPDKLSSAAKAAPKQATPDEELMTDDTEENYVPIVKPKVKQPIKQLKRPKESGPKITRRVVTPVEDQRSMYKPKAGGNEGDSKTAGNKGVQTGNDPFSKYYDGTGGKGGDGKSGKGGKGNGDNDNKGKGPGTGPPGPTFTLKNRSLQYSLPKPPYNSEEQGKVVVDITVNREGNVIKAVPGGRGTTTWDDQLLKQATNAALRAKFKSDASAPDKQTGTITYNFIRN